ncbi:major facilitator superfamily multidrug-resistance, DHA1 sub-family [Mycena crocata]|nr:major facilitator superfamily multidrug-resistance, DHA1 sub-family [Mycena crocata]
MHLAASETLAPVKPRTPIPKFQVFIVLLIQFAEPVTGLAIYPFVVQFVRDTGITGGDETKTGFYAGLLESTFFLAESLTVFQFGRLSDRYGRRPVLLFGPLGLCLSMLGFGLSRTFWMLFAFRCAQGAFNGNIGVARTVMSEISDPSNVADIFSLIPMMWSIAATFSPFMGGVLANAGTKWPDTLGKIAFLREHPYFLPCAVASGIALSSFGFAFVGLQETLPSSVARQRRNKITTPATETAPLLAQVETPDEQDIVPPFRELLTRPVLIAMLNQGLLAFCDMCYDALLPLVYATPISLGGLGLKPYNIGLIMGLCGISNAFIQVFLGGRIIRYLGPRRIAIGGFCALVVAFVAFGLLGFLAKRAGRIDGWVLAALILQLSCSSVVYFAFGTLGDDLHRGLRPNRASIGSVNGLAQMVAPTLRAVAPTFASSLFALSLKNNLAGGYMVYIVLVGVTLCAVRCAMMLPRQLRSEMKDEA